jgi:hypothetical protein
LIKNIFNRYFELTFWIVALICLALINPAGESHFSLCPLKMMGVKWCPGCGLGHSISPHGFFKSSSFGEDLGEALSSPSFSEKLIYAHILFVIM